jgi:pyridoxine kinase
MFPAASVIVAAMNLLSIQSHVAYGHVGNSAAVFALQRIGVEVWPVHTVQFANHSGYGKPRGQVFDAALIREVVGGIEDRGVLGKCDGVLSGYIGLADIGAAILDAAAAVKRANSAAKYCCDPVIGDAGRGIYVREDVPDFMKRKAVPAADVITPNQFELEFLAGRECKTLAQARDAVTAVHAHGPAVILVTSLHTQETPEDAVDLLASDRKRCFRLRTPRLPQKMNGAGDAIAALFFAHYLRSGHVDAALSDAASALFGVLSKTAEAGAAELALVAAQDELVKPSRVFAAQELRA